MKVRDLNLNDRIIIWSDDGEEGKCGSVTAFSYKNFTQETASVLLDGEVNEIELTDKDYFDRLPISFKEAEHFEDCKNIPEHYSGQTDVIEFTRQQFTKDEWIASMKFNIIKYATRLGRKDALDKELDKIIDYAQRLKEGL
ncbi:DUF3310 domain-containing protein [Staphylococcus simulans]|uniref:DUF3310 domain-containing protein n=1 Tax=Staphylococcus simulans TaxID=1286 RepID=UPI000CD16E5F|nr:DUF3310 domain-containing protein [Staphylococcus simulans]PNZ40890.1 hypothetical protein CD112_12960 [Staphylococcus simulans]SQE74659.1 Protein of unknwon function (DUF3310) [Staphylococcus simulans]